MTDPIEAAAYSFPSSWLVDDHHYEIAERLLAALSADGPVVLYDGKVLESERVAPSGRSGYVLNWGAEYVVARLPEGGDDE